MDDHCSILMCIFALNYRLNFANPDQKSMNEVSKFN
jgi:hypothetical protein